MGIVKFSNSLKHVAIIMDGNGRWAKLRSHPRVWGHVRGSGVVADIVETAKECGVEALTLYAFSSENWCRPQTEVRVLFSLLHKFLIRERDRVIRNQIRFKIMGDISNLPQPTQDLIYRLQDDTHANLGLKLTFAFGYGGRSEIVQAVNRFTKENPGKEMSEEDLAHYLLIPDLGDVDLLIRTGGDQRVSNFLLWQIAYAELYFTETKWPDFTTREFREIIQKVSMRERRFGATSSERDLKATTEQAKHNKNLIRVK